jgi:hypothetical protein
MSAEVAYSHAEAPRSVAANRGTKSKYRPPPQQEQFGNSLALATNIMFDRRVVRGNTYAAQIIPPVRSWRRGRAILRARCSRPPPRGSPRLSPLPRARAAPAASPSPSRPRAGNAGGDACTDGADKASEEE